MFFHLICFSAKTNLAPSQISKGGRTPLVLGLPIWMMTLPHPRLGCLKTWTNSLLCSLENTMICKINWGIWQKMLKIGSTSKKKSTNPSFSDFWMKISKTSSETRILIFSLKIIIFFKKKRLKINLNLILKNKK